MWKNKPVKLHDSDQLLIINRKYPFVSYLSLAPQTYWTSGDYFGNLHSFSPSPSISWNYLQTLKIEYIILESLEGIQGLKNSLIYLELITVDIVDQNLVPITELTNLKTLKWNSNPRIAVFNSFINRNHTLVGNVNIYERSLSLDQFPFEKFPGYKLVSLTELELQREACSLLPGFCNLLPNTTISSLSLKSLSLLNCLYLYFDDLLLLRNINFRNIQNLRIVNTDPYGTINSSFLDSFYHLENIDFEWSSFTDSKLLVRLLLSNNYSTLKTCRLGHMNSNFRNPEQEKWIQTLNLKQICNHLSSLPVTSNLEQEINKIIPV